MIHKITLQQLTSKGDRNYNQDYMLYRIEKDYALFILADGLGGHQAGEKASRYFCHSFIQLSNKYAGRIFESPKKVMAKWFKHAVTIMADGFQDDPVAHDAYTTGAILLITDKFIISAHCGDSRIYHLNQNEIVWRTKDHSIPQQLFDEGELAEHKMGTHPEQNQLTRSISIANKFPPDIQMFPPPKAGDTFIVCSDGFWEFTKEHEFLKLANQELEKEYLLKQAKMALFRANGKADNLTVQWVRVQ